ncbi:DUF3489 domain-containing protein [Afipia clevelandensis]|uniref:DUF3489 domain-containing protein n=1 Tax=Afipia clevelandensis TaxID=1034 RepID=UPI0009DA39DF|nr:DUF3489 domain-containing protein [Afipia clevelandensis]RTL78680.1 MAG: DUF3489 domain-containing protein [Bradyrhizobiaceae bacterium]
MTKAKKASPKRAKSSPRQTTSHSAPQRRTKPIGSASSPAERVVSRETKREKVLVMLRSNRGATIEAIVKATGWQQHSVRGFLSGVVRKRLKLDLASEKPGKDRIYRIKAARSSAAKATATGSMA